MFTQRTVLRPRTLMLALLCSPALAFAQQAEPASTLDPVAVTALDKMGQSLRALDHFRLRSDASTEVVLDDGQKIELDSEVQYQVQQPNRMAVDVKSDRRHRQMYYDGGKLTVYAPRMKYYATTDIGGKTLGELAIGAATNYGIDTPLMDLFFWGTEHVKSDQLTSAMHVGGGTMDGQRVDQYAYRQPGVDWQVWISQETQLPKKIVITNLDDPALPRYEAHLHWDTRSTLDAKAFTFAPPEGAAQIRLVPVTAVAVEQER